MRKGVGVVLPVATIKWDDSHRCRGFDKTSHVDINAVGIRTRGVKRFDATDATERMLRNAGIEGVGRQVIGPTKEMKRRLRHDQVKEAAFRADRAVAVLNFKRLWGVHFERYGAAVTGPVVDHAFGASSR